MKTPRAVLISDIHFTPNTLELASQSLRMAIKKATDLNVPLIIAGDTLDTKAVMRGECVNRLIEIVDNNWNKPVVIVGNHDLINEKSKEHTLNFLKPWLDVVELPIYFPLCNLYLLPYFSDSTELQAELDQIPTGATIIGHQGVQTAFMGHYVQDKSSLPPEAFKRFRTILGHYHRRQNIPIGDFGGISYIGTPYTTSFSEAEDGPKGFQILFDDGSLELVPTHLRKHVILDTRVNEPFINPGIYKDDLLWLKIRGSKAELQKVVKKDTIGAFLLGHTNFKLDLIPDEQDYKVENSISYTDTQLLDAIIDKHKGSQDERDRLKQLWRQLCD